MTIDKNYFLNRLANGEDMDAIGEEIAAMMTEAVNERNAQIEAEKAKAAAAEAEKEAAKREIIEELIGNIQDLAILEGMDPADMQVSEDDVEQLVAAFTEMFEAMRDLKKMFADMEAKLASDVERSSTPAKLHPTPSVKVHLPKSDEQILADFIKMFN